jgi:hypothetical protein
MITKCHYQEAEAWPESGIEFPAQRNEEMKSHYENSPLQEAVLVREDVG